MKTLKYLLIGLLAVSPAAEFWKQADASTVPTSPEPVSNRKFQWFGYSVFGEPSDIAEIATYSNFIWLRDWTKNGDRDQFAEAARRSGIKLVLEIPEKLGWNDIKDSAGPFIAKHRDVVAAICWNCPSFNGWTPEQLAKDARRLKQAFPELQCWVECVEFPRGKLDTKPVPPEMDVIVVDDFFDTKPKDVRKKTEAALPGWISKANGRPVLLQWFGIGYAAWNKPDGVALSRPETMRMCAEVAKEFGLAGLVFFYYGDAPERVEGNRGIETNPALVEEIQAIAKENGFSRADSPPASSPSLPTSSGIQPEANQSLVKTLSQQAPNATEWALAPLDQSVPGDIRQNLTSLREDLLDEAKASPKAVPEAYAVGRQLCDTLMAVLDERDATLVRVGYRAAQANANTGVSTQAGQPLKIAIEARRNYMMSWPQYAREKDQAGEIFRQQMNNATLTKELPKVEWSNRTAVLRKTLDSLYAKYREALRQGKK